MRTLSVLVPRRTSHESNGLENRACRVLHEPQPLDVLVSDRHDNAANAVAVAVQVLRRAVDDEVRSQFDGTLQARTGERVVHDQPDVVTVREVGGAPQGR